jgi:hypothetical protein
MRTAMKKIILALALSAVSYTAMAHAPFTAPSNYVVNGANTSILAGFAESPFDSEVSIKGFDFHVVNPKGEVKAVTLSHTQSLSTANVDSSVDGTYQIIGKRAAAIQYAKVGKRWLRVLDAKGASVPPLEAREFILPTELTTKHEKFDVERVDTLLSYFSKYQSSELAKHQTGTGLGLTFSQHPSLFKVGQPVTLTVALGQKAVADYAVHIEKQQTDLAEKPQTLKLKTNAQGQVVLNANQSGQYIITITSPETAEHVKPAAVTYRTIVSIYVAP